MLKSCLYKCIFIAAITFVIVPSVFSQEMEFYNLYFDGNSCYSKKQYSKAITYYNKALEIHSDKDFLYFNRGNSKLALNNYKGAIADYNKTLALNNKYAEAYYQRALIKFKKGNKESGCEDLKTAKKLELSGVSNDIKKHCK